MMGDAVAAAATNGPVWTSVLRDVLLNNAIRRWVRLQFEAKNYEALRGYLNTEGKALTNNVLTLSSWTGGVAYILSATNTTDSLIVRKLPDGYDSIVQAGSNVYYVASVSNQFYKQEILQFRLIDGGTTTGDTIRLEYVKQHTDLTAGAASDTVVPPNFGDQVLKLAYAISREEKATEIQAALANQQIVTQEITKSGASQ